MTMISRKKKPFRKNGPVAKAIAAGMPADVTYAHDKAVWDRLLADGALKRAYEKQLTEIGDILVGAGILARHEIFRHGVRFAIREAFSATLVRQVGSHVRIVSAKARAGARVRITKRTMKAKRK